MAIQTDILVIGSGIAGLTLALDLADHAEVTVVTKRSRDESNTRWAQGGIAVVMGEDDSAEAHKEDTLVAGAGLCHGTAVGTLVSEGPARVRELVEWGTRFHREETGRLSLGREGGHSRRRIVHARDLTGREIERALLQAVADHPNIDVCEDHLALDLLLAASPATEQPVCRGALILDHRDGRLVRILARATLLAAGGAGQVYRHTTNPGIATGDGIAMAYRAGAPLMDMEFIQFHPTALYPTEDPAFLISEALRGEGAVLRRLDGAAFMERHHPLGSLAPRDVVARAVDHELKERDERHVVLDVSAIDPGIMQRRFPGALEGCHARGIDPWQGGIPVVPAAHYVCGGVLTDASGTTSIPGLYASGEVACTGVHGANRLASNSLLEALVFSHRAAEALRHSLVRTPLPVGEPWIVAAGAGDLAAQDRPLPDPGEIERDRRRMRDVMWDRVGIVRSVARLQEAEAALADLRTAHEDRWRRCRWTADSAELRNLLESAALIVRCALLRRESRGLHHTMDHPWRDNERYLGDTVVRR
ncbi:MAG: L-aspartate oxidase [Gemmatimonadetes bacterium]|nr:L-aspartate oxidase [Gemmatimonadota bacterium]